MRQLVSGIVDASQPFLIAGTVKCATLDNFQPMQVLAHYERHLCCPVFVDGMLSDHVLNKRYMYVSHLSHLPEGVYGEPIPVYVKDLSGFNIRGFLFECGVENVRVENKSCS